MRVKLKDGIYGKVCNSGNERLLFRKVIINGKLAIAYCKNNNVIAYKNWDEVVKEMYMSGPCMIYNV